MGFRRMSAGERQIPERNGKENKVEGAQYQEFVPFLVIKHESRSWLGSRVFVFSFFLF